jgi:hypothetical protein
MIHRTRTAGMFSSSQICSSRAAHGCATPQPWQKLGIGRSSKPKHAGHPVVPTNAEAAVHTTDQYHGATFDALLVVGVELKRLDIPLASCLRRHTAAAS